DITLKIGSNEIKYEVPVKEGSYKVDGLKQGTVDIQFITTKHEHSFPYEECEWVRDAKGEYYFPGSWRPFLPEGYELSGEYDDWKIGESSSLRLLNVAMAKVMGLDVPKFLRKYVSPLMPVGVTTQHNFKVSIVLVDVIVTAHKENLDLGGTGGDKQIKNDLQN